MQLQTYKQQIRIIDQALIQAFAAHDTIRAMRVSKTMTTTLGTRMGICSGR